MGHWKQVSEGARLEKKIFWSVLTCFNLFTYNLTVFLPWQQKNLGQSVRKKKFWPKSDSSHAKRDSFDRGRWMEINSNLKTLLYMFYQALKGVYTPNLFQNAIWRKDWNICQQKTFFCYVSNKTKNCINVPDLVWRIYEKRRHSNF